MKETTLREILKFNPCQSGLKNLLEELKYSNPVTDEELNKPIKTKFIYDNNGYKDCLWVLQVFTGQPDWYRFKADIAESVLHIFEKKYPGDNRPNKAIQAARYFADGKISKEELTAATSAASAATSAAYAADSAAAATAAYAAAYSAAYAATSAAYAAYSAASAADSAAAREKQIKKNTEILLKYIGD
jgi:hypothetical protein